MIISYYIYAFPVNAAQCQDEVERHHTVRLDRIQKRTIGQPSKSDNVSSPYPFEQQVLELVDVLDDSLVNVLDV
jgi:hypothetical protein